MPTSLEIGRKSPTGMVVCNAPCVCLTPTPTGPVPIPYMIVCSTAGATPPATKTTVHGVPVMRLTDYTQPCMGNQPGTVGGVISATFSGTARAVVGTPTILTEGKPTVKIGDAFLMNCLGPMGPANTFGTLVSA